MAITSSSQAELDALVGAEPGSAEAAPAKKPRLGKKKLLLLALPVVLLLGLGGAYAAGLFDGLLGGGEEHAAAEAPPPAADPIFFDLPEMLVNLHTTGSRASYLKLRLSLQFTDPAVTPVLQKLQPRVIDAFQVYLRELRLEDLQGSAGMLRLKEELLARADQIVAPAEISDVLFKDMLVQ